MAAELPRPGVEIIQSFTSASPTIVRPTLVPCVAGAAKEIVEVTKADGTLNSDAKQGSYDQLPRTISQTSFPSPRDNISEVDVEEATIRAFLLFGGKLNELEREPGESFLVGFNNACRPAFRSAYFVTSTGLDLDGTVLVIAIDTQVPANTTKDITVTFASDGSNLTPAQICDQINAAVGDDVASEVVLGSNSRIQIASNKFGAAASVTIRAGGSANTLFGLTGSAEYRVTGSGFRAQEQNNNTTLSPWIEWSPGTYLVDGATTAIPTYDDDIPTAGFSVGFLDSTDDTAFSAAFVQSSLVFTSSGLDLKVGDEFVADGVLPNTTAVIMKVESSRFKLGILNATLSVFDDNGKVTSAVYDQSSVNTLLASSAFAPRYAWFMAKGLEVNDTATAAELTGSVSGTAATTATIEAPSVLAGSSPYALAGLTLDFDVTVDGVAQDTQTFTFTGGPFADLTAVIAAFSGVDGVFAHTDTGGTKIAFSTDLTGAQQSLTIRDSSTALAALGFSASTEYSDDGTDVEFVDVAAILLGGTQTFPFTAVNGETFIVQISTDGGLTYPTTKTYTFATGNLSFANIAALVTELGTATRWAGGVLPTQFAITAQGNKLKITSTDTGSLVALRIGSSSTAIGATTNSDLLFTSLQADVGEENLNGQTLEFTMNDREKTYSVVFTSDSLVDAVAAINEVVGTTVASIGGDADDQLVLTSTLKGYASAIDVSAGSTSTKARNALGFGSGNTSADGSGRPNPDFSVDVSGNVVLGAEIIRSALTGAPFDPGNADIYIQYRGLRKDVSPVASSPALLRISDIATLQTVLSPLTADNPLGLGMFFEMINAPAVECTGIGVDETSSAKPYGTLAAFARVTSFLESQEVYALAPLTDDVTVHSLFETHATTMSGSTQKGERIVFVCPPVPTRAVDDVVGSGLSGGTTATENQFLLDDSVTGGLTDRGLNPLDLAVDDNVVLTIEVSGEVRHYSVSAVNNTLVTVRDSFDTGENEDGYFSTATLSETLVNEDWSLAVRGDKLLIPGSTLPDKALIAETVQASNQAHGQRRLYSFFPDTVKATVGGIEQELPGFYACAATAGMVAKFPPQQGFTNLPITGFTGVVGARDKYSEQQLDVMAAGGTYIIVQDAVGAPLVCRHQLSTNLTSIETRELSITKVVDFVAKFMRVGLRNFIGTFNITQPFLDTLSTVIQGMLGFLTEAGVINGGDLNNLIQSEDQPDTVLVDVTLDVPFPCNYIRLTLAI
jgi:hypothetical protein